MSDLTLERVGRLYGPKIMSHVSDIMSERGVGLDQAVSSALGERRKRWLADTVAIMNAPISSSPDPNESASG
jgi:hypothetical protein